MQKRCIFVTLITVILMVKLAFRVAAANISEPIKYDFFKQAHTSSSLNLINHDLQKQLILKGNPYLELQGNDLQVIVGKQNNILGDGFVAVTSGIDGIRTVFNADSGNIKLLYGNNGKDVVAANLSRNFKQYNNLNVEALYFKTDSSFFGIKVSSKILNNMIFSAQTSENLVTKAQGYLVMTKYEVDAKYGKNVLAVSYRYVEPDAISDYSGHSVFEDSQGLRIETSYKLADNVTLTAFKDFVQAHDKSNKDASNVTLTWVF